MDLASALQGDGQLDAAEETASHAIDLLPEKGEEYQVCQGHRVLGRVYCVRGELEKAIHQFEVALGIASSFNIVDQLFWAHFGLADLFSEEGRFDDAHTHLERAKRYGFDDPYRLARVSELWAEFGVRQHMFEEAKSEALRALDIFEELGAVNAAAP